MSAPQDQHREATVGADPPAPTPGGARAGGEKPVGAQQGQDAVRREQPRRDRDERVGEIDAPAQTESF
ncbi:hypothetical protein, partial [Nocardia neocaledoniensis]|uniref:hypothetical protein n=1 Tax=Nocardia neocaledoniensis TaxID=236511 RepID=UPI002454DF68